MNPSTIYGQNNSLINDATGQAANYSNQYNQNNAQYQQAQSNLSDYQKYIQSSGDLGQAYGQNLQSAEQQFGFDPAELKNAQTALAATQTTMANLPQAVQQSANGRGLTGAQTANRLTQQGTNLQGVLAGQSNGVNALNSVYQNAQGQAGTQTGFQGQSQQMNLGALQNITANAQAQEAQAANQVQYFNSLRAQGISLNVQEQQAAASAAAALAQAQSVQQQTAMMAAQAALYNQQAAATPSTLSAAQQRSAASIGGTSASDIYNYTSPKSSIANRSILDPLTALGYALGLVH